MKKRLLYVCMLAVLAIGLLLLHTNRKEERALFSWSSTVLAGEDRQELFKIMNKLQLDVLYQAISADIDKGLVCEFLKSAEDNGVEVWLLTGEPSWGLDRKGNCMIEEIERAAGYNSELSGAAGLQGVLMDCEPYLTTEWDENKDAVMENWISAMTYAHKAAEEKDLLLSACIPYYLDTEGFTECLEELVTDGCDELAIMNYYKKNEAKHIQTEVELARAKKVPVTVIYELQPPGEHGLLEKNTYYNDGLSAIKNSWKRIKQELGGEGLAPALHEYHSLQEVMADE